MMAIVPLELKTSRIPRKQRKSAKLAAKLLSKNSIGRERSILFYVKLTLNLLNYLIKIYVFTNKTFS